jgi:hypothetical protein
MSSPYKRIFGSSEATWFEPFYKVKAEAASLGIQCLVEPQSYFHSNILISELENQIYEKK